MPGNFHIVILNDNLDKAYSELRDFIAQNFEDKNEGIFWFLFYIISLWSFFYCMHFESLMLYNM